MYGGWISRVSTLDQKDNLSHDSQDRIGKEAFTRNGVTMLDMWRISESASKSDRGEFYRIVKEIVKKGTPDGSPYVLGTLTVDRLSRNLKDIELFSEHIKKKKIVLYFAQEALWITDENLQAVFVQWGILSVFSAGFSVKLSATMKRTMQQNAERGRWSSKAPFGYRNVYLPDGTTEIVIEQAESLAVQEAFRSFVVEHTSIAQVADYLRSKGFKKTVSMTKYILSNPFYAGKLLFKGQMYPKDTEEEVRFHQHPKIIDYSVWLEAQARLKTRSEKATKRTKHTYLFQGEMRCSECGRLFVGSLKKATMVYYSCSSRSCKCNKVYYSEKKLEEQFAEALTKLRFSDELQKKINNLIKKNHSLQAEKQEKEQRNAQTLLLKSQTRLDKLIFEKLDGNIDETEYQALARRFRADIVKYEAELLQLRTHRASLTIQVEPIMKKLNNLAFDWKNKNFEQKKTAIKAFVYQIHATPEKPVIFLQEWVSKLSSIVWQE